MTLDLYLKRPGAKSLTELAALVGVSKGRLSQLRTSTDWPPQLALDVEQNTGGAIDAANISSVIANARKGAAA